MTRFTWAFHSTLILSHMSPVRISRRISLRRILISSLSTLGFSKLCLYFGFPNISPRFNKPWLGDPNNTWCGGQIIAGKNVIRNKIFIYHSYDWRVVHADAHFNPLHWVSSSDVKYFLMVVTPIPTWEPAHFAAGFVSSFRCVRLTGMLRRCSAAFMSSCLTVYTRSFIFTVLEIESLRHRK